jgi:hypothetical protein
MGDQVRHQVGGFTAGEGPTRVVERTTHHLDRDPFEWFVEALRHLLPHVAQDKGEEEGSIELELDTVGRGFPKVGELAHALCDQARLFTPPAPPVQLAKVAGRELRRIEDIGEGPIPLAPPEDREPAYGGTTGMRRGHPPPPMRSAR